MPAAVTYIDTAYYYMASRNMVEPGNSLAGMHGTGSISGFPNLVATLGANGYTVADIQVSFGILTLGNDAQGIDWQLIGSIEDRTYKGGYYDILIKGETILTGQLPPFFQTIDYKVGADPFDDIISGQTGFTIPQNNAGGATAGAQAVAAAFLQDVADKGVRFVFSSIQPAYQEDFDTLGRIGGLFSITNGSIEKGIGSLCSFNPLLVNIKPETGEYMYNGSIEIEVSGGTPPYNFNWSNGYNSKDIFGLTTGSYAVTVTDQNNCALIDTFFVGQLPPCPANAYFNYYVVYNDSSTTINFNNISSGPVTALIWHFGDGDSSNASVACARVSFFRKLRG
ncbi:MAG: hypothetical protein HC896_18025 [Bacteroidales bacterium]|nr:hypothetical protein [Bacteroidales bacterium]